MCNDQWWTCFYVYVKSGNWIYRTKERSVLDNVGSSFRRGMLLLCVDSRLFWIRDIVFDQGAVMPKLTPLTTSNKCLWTIKLGFTCDRPELIGENVAYIPNCSAIHRICGILMARWFRNYGKHQPRRHISWMLLQSIIFYNTLCSTSGLCNWLCWGSTQERKTVLISYIEIDSI